MHGEFQFLHILSNMCYFLFFFFFIVITLVEVKCLFIVVLISISLMTNEVEHFFHLVTDYLLIFFGEMPS